MCYETVAYISAALAKAAMEKEFADTLCNISPDQAGYLLQVKKESEREEAIERRHRELCSALRASGKGVNNYHSNKGTDVIWGVALASSMMPLFSKV